MKTDVLVLGAGMVGVSAALHLQARGRQVVLVDRRGAAEETSYGNAGIIQREGVMPYPFPRELSKMLSYALNRLPEANLHWSALPVLAPVLYRYWRHSTPERIAATSRAMRPLIERVIMEHEALMGEAGISAMLRRTGYLRVFRSEAALQAAVETEETSRTIYGVTSETKDRKALRELEPHLADGLAGGIFMPQPVTVDDPSAVGKAYAAMFVGRGGRFVTGDARTLEAADGGWQVQNVEGPIQSRDAVIALGPWSDEVLGRFGVRVPLGIKRGYHVHYTARGNATLTRPLVDSEHGYALAPMAQGIRLTTGAEFARRDAPPSPVQLAKVEPVARAMFPLDRRIEPKPWMGARPFLPDMLPMIGPVPGQDGLWADFGHHHLGFTLGPVTGRLLAEMMTGGPTFTDPFPYRVDRF
jgi:D-amino-acid dehydrogenase